MQKKFNNDHIARTECVLLVLHVVYCVLFIALFILALLTVHIQMLDVYRHMLTSLKRKQQPVECVSVYIFFSSFFSLVPH